MKRLFLLPVLLLAAGTAFGQIQIAPEAGVDFSGFTGKFKSSNTTVIQHSTYQPGIRLGVNVNLGVTENFLVQAGFFYNIARSKNDVDIFGYTLTQKMTVHRLQIPVYLMYRSSSANEGHFFAGLGPIFGMNFAGRIKSSNEQVYKSHNMKFGDKLSDGDDMRSSDVGVSATLGYQLGSGLFVRGYFNLGLTNLQPGGDNKNTLKSRSVGFSLGYFLGQ